jgi:hypothetical protein
VDAYTVREYVANWINAGGVEGLDKVLPAFETSQDFDMGAYSSGPMYCQGVVCIEAEREIRRSGPSANAAAGTPGRGMKWIVYQVAIKLCHQSDDPDWAAAERAFMQVIEDIRVMIRKDPSLGSSSTAQPLFDGAGEGRRGIQTQYDEPFTDKDTGEREQWAAIHFDAPAWITA